jgi:predicted nucleic acid-binding protein
MKKLTSIKENSFIFIDTNIFLYDFSGISEESREFLKLIKSGFFRGITSFHVLQELDHKLMLDELHKKYGPDVTKTKEKKLIKDENSIKYLSVYKKAMDVVLNMGIPTLSCSTTDFKRALKYQSDYGMLSTDAMNLALMKQFEIENIATNDKDFEKVSWLNVYGPGDIY